jgi:putative ABC transport system permease protein
MHLLATLGWRNLWRNRRRSLLTISAIAFSTFLTVVFRGIAIGTWDNNVRQTVEMMSGYLQIQKTGYQESPSLQKSIPYPGRIAEVIGAVPEVTAASPRIMADGLMSFRRNAAGAAIFGIDPASERRVSRFHDRVRKGRMIAEGSLDEVVVAATLLENLKAAIGDTVVLLSQGYDGVLGNQRFRIVGVLKMGNPDFDAVMVLMDIRAAQQLLAMEGRANAVAITVMGLENVEPVREKLVASLVARGDTNVSVLSWDEVIPELKQAMEFDIVNDNIFFGIIIIVVAFGILNTVLMSVTERFREFGVSMAMGMRANVLVRLVMLETMFLTFVGAVIGAIPGYIISIVLAFHPITFGGQLATFYEDYGFLPQVLGTTSIAVPLDVLLVILGIGFLACLYPARRVAKLEPLGGIRYT